MYSAIEKVRDDDLQDDCSDIDVIEIMKRFGIKTICLDEAHHLRNEWQKALEKFIELLDKNVKIISLTATPPYDAESSEWLRYKNVCGEIDEEIFIPELVGQNTLCPHQDYVYFNYPTESETKALLEHKERARQALEDLKSLDLFSNLRNALNDEKDYDVLFSNVKEFVAVATLLKHFGLEPSKKFVSALTAKKGLPPFKMSYAETALQFLLDGDLLSEDDKSQIVVILKERSVYEKKKVTLELDEKLKRTIISSVGKLESIKSIVESETDSMKDKLRMLILTDYIKKESLSKIASSEKFGSVNVVSIFETLRRLHLDVNLGVLSGSLVILPKSIQIPSFIKKTKSIEGTNYCIVEFTGAVHRIVDYVGKLFDQGKIQILIGTKSLLGEGWDSPCINSLILSSFVGSFVLSNQMRGRAIRVDKNDGDKTANIWHLATIEPDYLFKNKTTEKFSAYVKANYDEIDSCDYEILKRRFDTFMGPNYSTGVIESGIERITIIKPPFNEKGIERINKETLALSRERDEIKNKWRAEVTDGKFAINVEEYVKKDARVPVFNFRNFALCFLLLLIETVLCRTLFTLLPNRNIVLSLVVFLLMTVFAIFLYDIAKKVIIHFNPANSIKTLGKAVYETLTECGIVSQSAKVEVTANKELYTVSLRLRNASMHDQNVFNTAMTELLSPIKNPRYLLIAKNVFNNYNYTLSFACPSVIGKKKEFVQVLAKKLKATTGNFEPVFTRREYGRRLILKCRKHSYITFNENATGKKYRLSHWD